jgi:hypothetical protein
LISTSLQQGLLRSAQKHVRTEVFHAEGTGTGIAIADVSAWIAVTLDCDRANLLLRTRFPMTENPICTNRIKNSKTIRSFLMAIYLT